MRGFSGCAQKTLRPFVVVCALLYVFAFTAQAQSSDVKVRGGFLSDSLKIGEQTAFYLSAHYPSNLTILFPDSTFDFTPFEFQRKTFATTQTQSGISNDSAVYYLTTFEVGRVQMLDLPIFIVQAQDCTAMRSPRDSILVTQLVAQPLDTIPAEKLPLKMNTAYQPVAFDLNFWVIFGAVVFLLIVAILTWFFFGTRIRQYFRAKKLKRKHQQFLEAYNALLRQLQSAFSSPDTESALVIWKRYLEQLEARPYTKLTTREMLLVLQDEMLAKNLRLIDQAIYGHNTFVVDSLEHLKQFADQRFEKKLQEVKHE